MNEKKTSYIYEVLPLLLIHKTDMELLKNKFYEEKVFRSIEYILAIFTLSNKLIDELQKILGNVVTYRNVILCHIIKEAIRRIRDRLCSEADRVLFWYPKKKNDTLLMGE